MLNKVGLFKRILRAGAIMLFAKIENNNNCEFSSNGEKKFIEKLFYFFQKSGEIIIFDIGANIGEYSQMLLDYTAKANINSSLHVFEPTNECFKILESKFGTMPKIFINKQALSDAEGEVEIFYDKEKSGLASLYKRNLHYAIEMSQSEVISTICAENYIESHQIKHINFLKIDIEGHELKALQGFGKYLNDEFIDFIQFEYGGANLDSHSSLMELYDLLEKKGFVLAKIMPKGLDIRNYKPYMENFYYSNYVAISNKVIGKLQ